MNFEHMLPDSIIQYHLENLGSHRGRAAEKITLLNEFLDILISIVATAILFFHGDM
jgi:hypothetical protein